MADTDSGPLALLPLTEQDRRRSDWVEGAWLTLGNGERFSFPEVRAERTTSSVTHPGIVYRIGKPSCSESEAAFQTVLDRIQLSTKEENDRRAFGIGVEIGGALLRRNYFLTDDDLDQLLSIGFWRRSLVNRGAYNDAVACYNAIQRIAFDQPMRDVARIIAGLTGKTN